MAENEANDQDPESQEPNQEPTGDANFAEVIGNVVDSKMTLFLTDHIKPLLAEFAGEMRKELTEATDPNRLASMLSSAATQAQIDNAMGVNQNGAVKQLEAAGAHDIEHVHEEEQPTVELGFGSAGQVAQVINFAMDTFMKLSTFRQAQNPIQAVVDIARQNPSMAPYMANAIAPQPDTATIANASTLNGFQQGFKAGQQAKGIGSDVPLVPSGGPINSSAGPSPTSSEKSATMSESTRPAKEATNKGSEPRKYFDSFMRS